MQRTLLIALATAVVAAGIATGATIFLSDSDDLAVTSPTSPASTPEATTTVTTTTATASPSATTATAAAPRATDGRRSQPTATAAPTPTMKPLASVDCSDEPFLCSDTTGRMTVTDDTLQAMSSTDTDTSYSGRPTVRMTSKVLTPDDKTASKGDDVKMLRVDVVVRNDTRSTFVFPERVIGLDVYRNGRIDERLTTKGEGFEMPPGAEMRGKFDKPIVKDGEYTWQAKTWYYTKS